jgi:hypothetical protein
VTVGALTVALVRTRDAWHALEGRCPWYGYDFSVATGAGVGNDLVATTLQVRERDGVVEVLAPKPKWSSWTVGHVMAETFVNWGIDTAFGMVGHSNLGLAEALCVQAERGRIRYFGIRHEGAAAFACSGYARSPTGRRRASRSRVRAPPTSSPASGTPRWTVPRCSRSPGRSPPR